MSLVKIWDGADYVLYPGTDIATQAELDAHAADLTEHGGGVLLDQEMWSANSTSITAVFVNVFSAFTTLGYVSVPLDNDRPQRVVFDGAIGISTVSSGSTGAIYLTIAPPGSTNVFQGKSVRKWHGLPLLSAQPNGESIHFEYLVPAGTAAGDWVLGGNVHDNATAGVIIGSSVAPSYFYVERM